MNQTEVMEFSKERLVGLVQAYARLISALDGLWFLAAEKEQGYATALKLDTDVWREYSQIEATRLLSLLDGSEDGISSVLAAFKLRPTFMSKEYEVTKLGGNKARVRILRCRTLEAMERARRTVFPCATNAPLLYPRFAKGINPRARLTFTKLPPRDSPHDSCCEWELEV